MTVRKVLGAPVRTILHLLTFDYLKLIAISIVVAVPVAWYAAAQWLQDFSYRIPYFWDAFVFGGIILLLVAFSVVSFHSLKAALSNPATGLRNE